MRDMLILGILVFGCLWSLREAWIGSILWTVVSLASPHQQFGYAAGGWPVSAAIGGCTLVSLLVTRARTNPFENGAVTATLALAIWMCITYPFSLAIDLCYDLWERSMKIFLMLFVTVALIDTPKKLHVFIWANVVSIGYYGVKGGLFALLTGGHFQVLGPGGFIAGNNEMALAEIVSLPLMRYLQLQAKGKWLRRALGVSIGLMAISAIVSQSRGALVGIVAMAGFFWLKTENKFRWGLVIVLAGTVGLGAMPDEWWNRMDTIKNYEQDTSAQGRINSWWLAWNIATDRVTGGGFRLTVPWIFAQYAPDPKMIFVAHSIYFQMMGEHGFIGLLLFLLVGVLTWTNSMRMTKLAKGHPERAWADDLGRMIQVSMIGFGATGAFLSMAYFDLPFNVMAMSALGLKFALMPVQPQAEVPAPPPKAEHAGKSPLGHRPRWTDPGSRNVMPSLTVHRPRS